MPYNIVVADASGAAASVEIYAGGGAKVQPRLIATNHQNNGDAPDRGVFTKTFERSRYLSTVLSAPIEPSALAAKFGKSPLKQDRYAEGFGTLFTAEYAPKLLGMTLYWDGEAWHQSLDKFEEGQKTVHYGNGASNISATGPNIDWAKIGMEYAAGRTPDWRSFVVQWHDAA